MTEEYTINPGFVLNDKAYKSIKWFVQLVLPSFATFYMALDAFVDVPSETSVVGVCALLATFLGTTLGISAKNYNASPDRYGGQITVAEQSNGVKTFTLMVNGDPSDLQDMDEVTFRIAKD